MKNLALILSLVMFFASCKIMPMGNPVSKNPPPFVQLKNGKKIDATKVKVTKAKIKADKTSYKRKDVQSFSTGKDLYVKYGKKSFAKKVYEGDINVYQTIHTYTSTDYSRAAPMSYHEQYGSGAFSNPSGSHSPGTFSHSSHTVIKYYLQRSDTGKLDFMNYKMVKSYIPEGDKGYPYLKVYRQHRLADRLVVLGGVGMFVGGAIIAGNSVNSNSGAGLGLGMLFGGMGVMATGAIMGSFNHFNLHRAIAKHNGVRMRD